MTTGTGLVGSTIRAVRVGRLGSIENGEIDQVARPVPGPGEVLVEVHAAPVNYVDVITIEGKYQFHPTLPYTPGKGPAGVVTELGSNVDDFAVGDRVLAMAEYGGYAEAVAVDHKQVHRLPDSLDLPGAAAMSLAFDTAWMALRERARFDRGESILVLGASGAVGGATLQLARAMGASLILAGLQAPGRLIGSPLSDIVDGTVDLGQPNLRDSVRDRVFELTGGKGVDVVVDAVGGDAFDGGIRSLAWRGRFVVVGFASGRIASLQTNYVLLKNIALSGLQISNYRLQMPELVSEAFRETFGFLERGLIRVPEYRTMPLDDWAVALRRIKERVADRRLILLPHG